MREIYQLTRKSFNGLDNEVMPGDLIDKLRPLEDHQFFSLTNLFGAVAKLIGAKQTNTYRKVILKHISFSCHRFDHVIREYKKRETRRRSKCSLCCRQFYNDTWHYNTDEPDFMSRAEFNALERTTVHEDHENWVHEYLLRCPSCGTYYWKENHIVWSDGGSVFFLPEHYFVRLHHPMRLAETYVCGIREVFIGLTWEGLTITPQKPRYMMVEVRSTCKRQDLSALQMVAEEWSQYLCEKLEPNLGPRCVNIPYPYGFSISLTLKTQKNGGEYRSVRGTKIHEKDIGRLFYGAKLDPLYLNTPRGGQLAIDIKTITRLHIRRSNTHTFSRIKIETVNGTTYFGTIRQEGTKKGNEIIRE